MATRQSAGKSGKRTSSGPAKGPAPRSAAARAGATRPSAAQAAPQPRSSGAAGWFAATARWAGGGVPLATLIVSVLGLADSAYLVYQHFSAAPTFVGCSDKGTVNCEAVTTSAWSYLFGSHLLPVSVLGLAFFLFMIVINSPWGWRAPWPAVHWIRLGAAITGVVMVLYLIWAELFRINAICLYCTGVHLLTFILFGLIVGKAAFSGVRAVPGRD
ncbi:MAG: vitamin K epoxide reductase family protein [Streptosporangiaceae bacterium]